MQANGLAWDKIHKMISEGKKNGDPLANLIYDMNFDSNSISILLPDFNNDDMSEMIPVEIDVNLSGYLNA